jgi:hypothetical protein
MSYVRLTGLQQLDLRNALSKAFSATSLQALLLSINRSWNNYVGADPYPTQVLAIVKSAEEETWLLELLAAARLQRPADLELARLERELMTFALPVGFDPFDMCCLSGEYVMVNRSHLRAALKAMRAPDGKRILIVRDKAGNLNRALECTKTGKTLSVQLISALRERLGAFELVWIDLRNFQDQLGAGVDILPRDIALRLVRQLGYNVTTVPDVPNDLQWSRWVVDFCDDFESQARSDPRRVWIVIDEFNKVALPQATLDLVKQLADRVRVTLSGFRLILLGYSHGFSPALRPHVEEDAIERQVSERDVVDFFISAVRQRRLQASEDAIVDAAAQALSGLDPSAEGYLEELGRRAWTALGRFPSIGV